MEYKKQKKPTFSSSSSSSRLKSIPLVPTFKRFVIDDIEVVPVCQIFVRILILSIMLFAKLRLLINLSYPAQTFFKQKAHTHTHVRNQI